MPALILSARRCANASSCCRLYLAAIALRAGYCTDVLQPAFSPEVFTADDDAYSHGKVDPTVCSTESRVRNTVEEFAKRWSVMRPTEAKRDRIYIDLVCLSSDGPQKAASVVR